jgi:diguanylate cyclase (GGDEF)-like protein
MGNVLLLSDDPDRGVRLRRLVEAAGLRPVLLTGRERLLLDSGTDEAFDLVVVDLDEENPAARAMTRRLDGDGLFEGVPQIRFGPPRSPSGDAPPDGVAGALLVPQETGDAEFAARVRLGAEIGRLRREVGTSALRDPLTGIFNRRYLRLRLEAEFARARRHRSPVSLVLFDVDRLREINDAYGQEAGDSVIRRLGELLRTHVRREDVLARTGEESFGILLSGNRYRGAAILANKIRTEVETLLLPFDRERRGVRISAGLSSYPDNRTIERADDLVRMAENALREAKARGGNRVHIDAMALGGPKRRVLVVDADPALTTLVEDVLAIDDLEVETAETHAEALEALRLRGADVLLLDLSLAGPPGEPAILDRIVPLLGDKRLPIVAFGREAGGAAIGALPPGIDRLLTKPFSVSLLRGVVRELLEGASAAATPM